MPVHRYACICSLALHQTGEWYQISLHDFVIILIYPTLHMLADDGLWDSSANNQHRQKPLCWLSADVIQTEAVTLEMSGVGNICQWKGYKKNKSICYMVETAHSISFCHKFLMNAYEVELICL